MLVNNTDKSLLAILSADVASLVAARLKDAGIAVASRKAPYATADLVMILVDDALIPDAVKVLENLLQTTVKEKLKSMGMMPRIIIPVDFSQASFNAVATAVKIADMASFSPLLVHSYQASPYTTSLGKSLDFASHRQADLLSPHDVRNNALQKFKTLLASLNNEIKSSALPDVKLSTEVAEGVAETMILDWARRHNPGLIVMTTRKNSTREMDVNGSITAEVIDSIRHPVLTLPEGTMPVEPDEVTNILLIASLTKSDLDVIDTITGIFKSPSLNIIVTSIPDDDNSASDADIHEVADYLWLHNPKISFSHHSFSRNNFKNELPEFMRNSDIHLIAVPNKRKNALSRLFNPGLAHRILFMQDLPMLAVPV